MKKINWKIRVQKKSFWLAIVPAIFLLIQTLADPFGYKWDFVILNQQAAAIINAAFAVLSILGIVTDPTTEGLSDSKRALNYSEPRKDEE
ncbi:phage holin [Enterococcus sp. AZ007]|uniref:phage holin n=1 Tax=Enterococcus sp. AZ007 TaxID=2774839 RepID=UPI003F25134A